MIYRSITFMIFYLYGTSLYAQKDDTTYLAWSNNYHLSDSNYKCYQLPRYSNALNSLFIDHDTAKYRAYNLNITKAKLKKYISDVSNINIYYAYYVEDGYFCYTVVSLFEDDESCIFSNRKDFLDHEQIHFDICELYARKIRKRLENLTINDCFDSSCINNIIAYYDLKRVDEDDKFNSEFLNEALHEQTTFKTNKIWSAKINKQIESLKGYEKNTGEVKTNNKKNKIWRYQINDELVLKKYENPKKKIKLK